MQVNPTDHPTLRKAMSRIYAVSRLTGLLSTRVMPSILLYNYHAPPNVTSAFAVSTCISSRPPPEDTILISGPRSLGLLLRRFSADISQSSLKCDCLDSVRGVIAVSAGSGSVQLRINRTGHQETIVAASFTFYLTSILTYHPMRNALLRINAYTPLHQHL